MRFEDYTAELAERHGRIDGRGWQWTWMPWFTERFGPIPAAGGTDTPPFVEGVAQAARAKMQSICAQWAQTSGQIEQAAGPCIIKLSSGVVEGASQTSTALRVEYVQLRDQREAAWKSAHAQAESVAQNYEHLCSIYETQNRRSRPEGEDFPPNWKPLELEIPEELTKLLPLVEALGYNEEQYKTLDLVASGD